MLCDECLSPRKENVTNSHSIQDGIVADSQVGDDVLWRRPFPLSNQSQILLAPVSYTHLGKSDIISLQLSKRTKPHMCQAIWFILGNPGFIDKSTISTCVHNEHFVWIQTPI